MTSIYRIITDEPRLDAFLASLPDDGPGEVYYLALFGRHKYDPAWPNARDSNQLARVVSRKRDLKEKIRRLEAPVGAYTRDGVVASQRCLAVYLSLNPRSLGRAARKLLVSLAGWIADGNAHGNPVSLALTEVHRAVARKAWLDFDFDGMALRDTLPRVREVLPDPAAYRVLVTRGGFHLHVRTDRTRGLGNDWYRALTSLPGCDVRGGDTLTPVPGCTQGGFTPYFLGEGSV